MSCGVNFALRIAVVFRKRSGMASERRYVDCLWPPVRQAVKGITVAASQGDKPPTSLLDVTRL
jgi:hypothetical protein